MDNFKKYLLLSVEACRLYDAMHPIKGEPGYRVDKDTLLARAHPYVEYAPTLETSVLQEKCARARIPFTLAGSTFLCPLINVSFKHTLRRFHVFGNVAARAGYPAAELPECGYLTDTTPDGVEILTRLHLNTPMPPLPDHLLEDRFVYDTETGCYREGDAESNDLLSSLLSFMG